MLGIFRIPNFFRIYYYKRFWRISYRCLRLIILMKERISVRRNMFCVWGVQKQLFSCRRFPGTV